MKIDHIIITPLCCSLLFSMGLAYAGGDRTYQCPKASSIHSKKDVKNGWKYYSHLTSKILIPAYISGYCQDDDNHTCTALDSAPEPEVVKTETLMAKAIMDNPDDGGVVKISCFYRFKGWDKQEDAKIDLVLELTAPEQIALYGQLCKLNGVHVNTSVATQCDAGPKDKGCILTCQDKAT